MRQVISVIAVVVLGGCSSVLGISDLTGPTGGPAPGADAGDDDDGGDPVVSPYDVTGNAMLLDSMTGTQTPLATTVDLIGLGGQVIATTTPRADGAFLLHVTSGGLGTALHAHRDPVLDTVDAYTLFATPLAETTEAGPVLAVTTAGLTQAEQTYFGVTSTTGGLTLVTAKSANNKTVAGVALMVTDFNATVRYLSSAGVPDSSLKSTAAGGQIAVLHPAPATTAYIATGAITAATGAVSITANSFNTLTLQGGI